MTRQRTRYWQAADYKGTWTYPGTTHLAVSGGRAVESLGDAQKADLDTWQPKVLALLGTTDTWVEITRAQYLAAKFPFGKRRSGKGGKGG